MIYLGHGASGNADSMRPYVDGLDKRGVAAKAVQLPRGGGAERALPVFLEQSGSGPEIAVGGQSFGGRVASMLAVAHPFRALVLFSYPLHRPGFPDQLRTAHWPQIRCPVLLLSGESDPFATTELLRREVAKLVDHELVTYPGGGHGLKGANLEDALDRVASFLANLPGMSVEKGRLLANGISFSVLAAGGRDRPVVLLLHGFPEGKESWEPQLIALADAGYRAVAPDLRGFGGTDAPKGVEAYGMPHLVADVEGLISALGEDQVDLVGHDWGALVGWPFVSRRPRLVRSWTSLSVPHPSALARASGLDGNPNPDPDQQARSSYIGLFQKTGKAEEVLLENGAQRLRAMYRIGPNPDAIPEETAEGFIGGFQREGRLTAGLNYYRANLKPAAYAAYPPCPNPITPPTLLLWGDQDPALGRRGVEATAALVEGPYRLTVLEGAGHWLQFERAGEVSRALIEHIGGE